MQATRLAPCLVLFIVSSPQTHSSPLFATLLFFSSPNCQCTIIALLWRHSAPLLAHAPSGITGGVGAPSWWAPADKKVSGNVGGGDGDGTGCEGGVGVGGAAAAAAAAAATTPSTTTTTTNTTTTTTTTTNTTTACDTTTTISPARTALVSAQTPRPRLPSPMPLEAIGIELQKVGRQLVWLYIV
jgi:hypothetical protein